MFCSRTGNGIPITCTTTYQKWTGQPIHLAGSKNPLPLGMGSVKPRKEEANVDVLLDDGIHNLRRTTAEYPVLMQRPWNAAEKNYVTVSGFEEFLAFMGSISI